MNQAHQRESNMELLRIISMISIVIFHFVIHAIIPSYSGPSSLMDGMMAVLHIGTVCFILISGYFGIKFSLKGLIKLYVQCTFYSIVIYAFYISLNPDEFILKDFVKSFFPVQLWFIQVYFCLYLISPIINIPLQKASTQKKIFLIVLLGIISFVFGQFVDELKNGMNVVNFIFIYYIGNLIRYNIKCNLRSYRKHFISLYLILNLVVFLTIFLSGHYSNVNYLTLKFFYPFNGIGLIINAILFLLIFLTIQIKSKFINWIAISALPIYLIHENKYVGKYLYGFVTQLRPEISNIFVYPLIIVFTGLVVCVLCVLIDKLLSPIIEGITIILLNNKYIKLLDAKIESLLQEKSE